MHSREANEQTIHQNVDGRRRSWTPRGLANALPVSSERIECLMEGDRVDGRGKRRRLMMELEGGHRNSVIKRRNPIEFGLVFNDAKEV
ncbi:hypothetical protein EVAR_88496_1 [Eumeta japonica]|uniref:Uncharacterized protein n=1 Tax=Eumeta variegata TaxID=151549 RepID=A0A4C1XR21_EUMVA|nr:hypothetical protein EVAR_88496_1 [Eumeta japonica]